MSFDCFFIDLADHFSVYIVWVVFPVDGEVFVSVVSVFCLFLLFFSFFPSVGVAASNNVCIMEFVASCF